jgi:hypothetical protein
MGRDAELFNGPATDFVKSSREDRMKPYKSGEGVWSRR